jgi:2-amino-4-hydroxy-6-hydroxymethyldihydropteridine diphosphokinase
VDATVLACIGLGANVGPARQTLEHAVMALCALPGVSLAGVSRLYRTRPVGPVMQADFLNAAAALQVPAGRDPGDGATALLIALKALERALGRQERERWGPREVDLDLLLFGTHQLRVKHEPGARSDDPVRGDAQWLEVPHPLAAERAFVLAPLADLVPDLALPGWGLTAAQAWQRAAAREGPDAVQVVGVWDAQQAGWLDLDAAASGGSGGAP